MHRPGDGHAIEKRTDRLGIRDVYTLLPHEHAPTRQLGELRPDDYPPFYETVNEAGFTSSSTVTTTYETSL